MRFGEVDRQALANLVANSDSMRERVEESFRTAMEQGRAELRRLNDENAAQRVAIVELEKANAELSAELHLMYAERTVGNSWHGQMVALTGEVEALRQLLDRQREELLRPGPGVVGFIGTPQTSTAGGGITYSVPAETLTVKPARKPRTEAQKAARRKQPAKRTAAKPRKRT